MLGGLPFVVGDIGLRKAIADNIVNDAACAR